MIDHSASAKGTNTFESQAFWIIFQIYRRKLQNGLLGRMMIFESYKGLGYLKMGKWGMLDQ
jgi:hypothetical protein